MEKDIVVILEDEESIRNGFQQLFEDLDLDIELLQCATYEKYQQAINDLSIKPRVKGFIMDLSNNQTERDNKTFEAKDFIMSQYSNNRVPIFVHSAYLDYYNDLDDKGTVFKIKKDAHSTFQIVESIKLMKEAGFLDIFCFEGSLQSKIMDEIHEAFIGQFKGKEIEGIIKSIKAGGSDKLKERTVEVFERIAIRAVYQNLISNKDEHFRSIKLNAIEYYYRRRLDQEFNTGDLFVNSKTNQIVFVATPRCNLANKNFSQILLCEVNTLLESDLKAFAKVDNLQKGITDDVKSSLIGERKRFLPKTPQFEGGFVDLARTFSIDPNFLKKDYTYKISLVDDLTNDVVRKLASYLLRGGISDANYPEALHYLKELEEAQRKEGGADATNQQ